MFRGFCPVNTDKNCINRPGCIHEMAYRLKTYAFLDKQDTQKTVAEFILANPRLFALPLLNQDGKIPNLVLLNGILIAPG